LEEIEKIEMRILYIAPRYHPNIGGVEYAVKAVAERMVKLSHDVTVLAGEPTIDEPREEEIRGVRILRWPTWAPRHAYHVPKMRRWFEDIVRKLAREADVVHVHSAHAILPVLGGFIVKDLNSNLKLVFTLHYHARGHTLLRELGWKMWWRQKVAKLVKLANKIHSVSDLEAERIFTHYSNTADRLVVIPNGVDEDVFQYKWKGQRSNYILYAGRIESYKNLELVINLLTKLSGNKEDLRLLIVGRGSHLPKLKRYVKRVAHGKVEFREPLSRKEYLSTLANARYAINLSEDEAFSIFVAEALAIGVPTIVSRTIAKALGITTASKDIILLLESPVIKSWSICIREMLRSIYYNET
jgi:glycosyltransferase involved in cell wall biosynthesis